MKRTASRQVASECMGAATRRAARGIAAHYDREMAAAGMRGTQFTVLNAINVMGEPSIGELARALSLDRTTLTRNLDVMVGNGWIERRVDRGDRRGRTVGLTPHGHERLTAALPRWRRAQGSVLRALGDTDLASLRHALQTIADL